MFTNHQSEFSLTFDEWTSVQNKRYINIISMAKILLEPRIGDLFSRKMLRSDFREAE